MVGGSSQIFKVIFPFQNWIKLLELIETSTGNFIWWKNSIYNQSYDNFKVQEFDRNEIPSLLFHIELEGTEIIIDLLKCAYHLKNIMFW